MAETKDVSKPKEPPKPVHIGGESLVDRILPHLKKIIIGAIVLSFVVTVTCGIRAYKHYGEEKETEKIAEALRVSQQPVALEGAKPDPKNPAFSDPTEREKAILDALSKHDADPPGHAYHASVLLGAGQVDQAIEEYKRGQDAKDLEGVLCREGLGIALEAKADAEKKLDVAVYGKLLAEALAVYQRMQPDEKGPRRAYALYHQGRVQAARSQDARERSEKAQAGSEEAKALLEEARKLLEEARSLFEKANELLAAERRHELRELLQKRLAALGAA
jgi:hypothetical protein